MINQAFATLSRNCQKHLRSQIFKRTLLNLSCGGMYAFFVVHKRWRNLIWSNMHLKAGNSTKWMKWKVSKPSRRSQRALKRRTQNQTRSPSHSRMISAFHLLHVRENTLSQMTVAAHRRKRRKSCFNTVFSVLCNDYSLDLKFILRNSPPLFILFTQNSTAGSIWSGRTTKSCRNSSIHSVCILFGISERFCIRFKSSLWNLGAHWLFYIPNIVFQSNQSWENEKKGKGKAYWKCYSKSNSLVPTK